MTLVAIKTLRCPNTVDSFIIVKPVMMNNAAVAGVIFIYLVSVVLCIPLNEFYPFGGDAPEAVHKLADGRDKFSGRVYVAEAIRFYGEPQETVIVSYVYSL